MLNAEHIKKNKLSKQKYFHVCVWNNLNFKWSNKYWKSIIQFDIICNKTFKPKTEREALKIKETMILICTFIYPFPKPFSKSATT